MTALAANIKQTLDYMDSFGTTNRNRTECSVLTPATTESRRMRRRSERRTYLSFGIHGLTKSEKRLHAWSFGCWLVTFQIPESSPFSNVIRQWTILANIEPNRATISDEIGFVEERTLVPIGQRSEWCRERKVNFDAKAELTDRLRLASAIEQCLLPIWVDSSDCRCTA